MPFPGVLNVCCTSIFSQEIPLSRQARRPKTKGYPYTVAPSKRHRYACLSVRSSHKPAYLFFHFLQSYMIRLPLVSPILPSDLLPPSFPSSSILLCPPLLPIPSQLFFPSHHLQMHRRQTQNLTPLLAPQLLADDAAQATADGLAALVDQHAGVVVELDHAAVRARVLLRGAHDDGVPDVAAAHFVGGADADAAAGPGLGAEVALLLHHHDDAVACWGRDVC